MKLMKRIIYTLLGLMLASAVVLVGVILFAEYSGRRFSPGSIQKMAGLDPEDSRLVYDEDGNVGELPNTSSESTAPSFESEVSSSSDTSDGMNGLPSDGESNEGSQDPTPLSGETSEPNADDNIERVYIMDMDSNIFHTKDCPYAENLAEGDRSEMTTTRAQVLNAGYAPCTNCNP